MLPSRLRIMRSKDRICAVALVVSLCTLALSIMVGVRSYQRGAFRGSVVDPDQQPDQSRGGSTPAVASGSSATITAADVQTFQIVTGTPSQMVVQISDGDGYDVQSLVGLAELDILVHVVGPIGFLEFWHNGEEHISKSYTSPYSFCDGMIQSLCLDLFAVGDHKIIATPFSSEGKIAGEPSAVSFVIVANEEPNGGGDNGSTTVKDEAGDEANVNDDNGSASTMTDEDLVQIPCGTPLFVGDWEWGVKPYPLNVAEAQGAKIGNDLVIIGGFIGGYTNTTKKVFARNLTDETADWRRMDDMPSALGITHASYAVVGEMLFMCGGYLGGSIAVETDTCLRYNHSAPSGRQWRLIRPLPEGRSGGGMVYDSTLNVLLYSAGATRPQAGISIAYDHTDSWMYNLSDPFQGWVNRSDIPFFGNHMGFVTAYDEYDRERHFFVGGQQGEHELTGNTKANYEWIAAEDTWVARESMPLSRGHAASATKAIGCGFLVAGGTTNEQGLTADISFYDIPSDTWATIGSLPSAVNTAVCEFGGEYLYCETGWATGPFTVRRKMVLS